MSNHYQYQTRRRTFSKCISLLTIIQSTQTCHGYITTANTSFGKRKPIPFVTTLTTDQRILSTPHRNALNLLKQRTKTNLNLRAPPGSGYFTDEDEQSFFPDSYEPMMEYPGTMRPGRTPENQPYSSLPIQESDPDPVPWPHFQEVEWHHNWGSPHEHPIPMEEFIEMHDRWASAEVEAEMRAGARRNVRERREHEEAEKTTTFVLDDDDDDDDDDADDGIGGTKLELGEGVDALIGAGAEAAASIAKPRQGSGADVAVAEDDDDEGSDGDNFLLDLGLDEVDDSDDEEDIDEDDQEADGDEPAFATGDDGTGGLVEALQSMIDAEDNSAASGGGVDDDEIDIDFDDLGLNFDDDDDEEEEGDGDEEDMAGDEGGDDEYVMDDDDISMDGDDLTLDEMIGNEDMGADDEFDDGGFDYD